MSFEFVVKNGLIASGSGIQTPASITSSNGYIGRLYDTASYAIEAGVADSISFVPATASYAISSSATHLTTADTASYVSESIYFPTAKAGQFPFWNFDSNTTLSTSSMLSTAEGTNLTASGHISGSITNAVSAISASFITASGVVGTVGSSQTSSYFSSITGSQSWKIFVTQSNGDLVFNFS